MYTNCVCVCVFQLGKQILKEAKCDRIKWKDCSSHRIASTIPQFISLVKLSHGKLLRPLQSNAIGNRINELKKHLWMMQRRWIDGTKPHIKYRWCRMSWYKWFKAIGLLHRKREISENQFNKCQINFNNFMTTWNDQINAPWPKKNWIDRIVHIYFIDDFAIYRTRISV